MLQTRGSFTARVMVPECCVAEVLAVLTVIAVRVLIKAGAEGALQVVSRLCAEQCLAKASSLHPPHRICNMAQVFAGVQSSWPLY